MVRNSEAADWKVKKWTGPGRGQWLARAVVFTMNPGRASTELDQMKSWRPFTMKPDGNLLAGPLEVLEYFGGRAESARSFAFPNADWCSRLGVPGKGICAQFNLALLDISRHPTSVDHLDLPTLVSGELLVCHLVSLERAAERNPKNPDWDGLDDMITAQLSVTGRVEVPVVTTWLSSLQRDKAQVLKQGRLSREERAAEAKRGKGEGKNKEKPND